MLFLTKPVNLVKLTKFVSIEQVTRTYRFRNIILPSLFLSFAQQQWYTMNDTGSILYSKQIEMQPLYTSS